MKISAFTIVFNAESTLPHNMLTLCVESMLPYVDEYFLVEGATRASGGHYFDGNTKSFTKDGRSNDGTTEVLRDLEAKYRKVKVIIGEGFWPGKTAMCNAASSLASGDYLWQIDSDEFYHQSDMEKIIHLLETKSPDEVDFYANHFTGGFNQVIDFTNGSTWGNDIPWRRIFKNTPGQSRWRSHEPPVYVNNGVPTCNGYVMDRNATRDMGIFLYHYSYVVKSQFEFKEKFYGNSEYAEAWKRYEATGIMDIFGIRPKLFTGEHPEIIKRKYLGG
jgi:glycosyltransferase involved in cell wall biosynthesis